MSKSPSLAELLELRLRLRGRPDTLALVDRALALAARAEAARDYNELICVQRQLDALGDDLAVRFGVPKDCVLQ